MGFHLPGKKRAPAKNKDHLFKKGKPKTGGRKPGVKNKIPTEMRQKMLYILRMIEENGLEKDIKKVSPGQRMAFYMNTLEYTAPKMARVDAEGNAVTEVSLTIKRNRK